MFSILYLIFSVAYRYQFQQTLNVDQLTIRENSMNIFHFFAFTMIVALINTFSGQVIAAQPKGYIDQVVFENNQWKIKGWACEPFLGRAIQVQLFLNNQVIGTPVYTNQTAEVAIHSACGTHVSSGIKYRFAISLSSSISLSGQSVKVNAISSGGTVALNGSNQFGLPNNSQTPDKILAAANRILLIVAHQDDEIVFAPFLGRYCESKTCKIVSTTNDPVRAGEWPVSMSKFPAQSDLGEFVWNDPNEHPSVVLQRWENQAASVGLINLNNVIAREIDRFRPDVILTFDPRHGTTCHSEHRATGEAVRRGVAAYTGANFPDKTKLFFLTTRRVDDTADSGAPYMGLAPIAPMDKTSVVYSAEDFISAAKGTGWQFVRTLLKVYPSQFPSTFADSVLNTPQLERTTAFQRVTNYSPSDSKYINANLYDPRFFMCPSW
jgi:LmbE family N-acetylglucosaminyl deacetylase